MNVINKTKFIIKKFDLKNIKVNAVIRSNNKNQGDSFHKNFKVPTSIIP